MDEKHQTHHSSWKEAEGDTNRDREALIQKRPADTASKRLLERDDARFLHQSLSTPCMNVLKGAKGVYLIDQAGNRIMDFHGNGVHSLGHGHPAVLEAVTTAIRELPFCPRRYTNRLAVEFAEALVAASGNSLKRVLFAPSGTIAISMALKLARLATGRHKVLSLWDSFHGASIDAISVGGERMFREGMGPLLEGCLHAPPIDPSACPFRCQSTCNLSCVDYMAYLMEKEGDIGAVLLETVRSTDARFPTPDYLLRIRDLCRRHKALLILDEIPIAFGRTGSLFAHTPYGIEPDILVLGKSMGGGVFPMAGILVREDLNMGGDIAIGHYTHEKSPAGCAAGIATLRTLMEDHLIEKGVNLGEQLRKGLGALKARFPVITDIRGKGLLFGVEIGGPSGPRLARSVLQAALKRGLSFKVGKGNTLVLAPPLVISEGEVDKALGILEAALACALNESTL